MIAYRDLVDWIKNHRDIGIDLVRMYLGIGLFVRGLLFIAESQGVEALVDLSAFSVTSAALAHYVTFAHLFGGLLLAAGLLTRLAALAQIPVLAGAVFLVHLDEGLLSANQSLEFSALVLFLLVVVFVFGPGAWSADRYVFETEPAQQDEEDLDLWWRDETPAPRDAPSGPEERVPAEQDVGAPVAVETAAKQAVRTQSDVTTCPCGHDLSHPRVTVEPRYGWSAGFFFMLGISAPVKEVVFYCERCGTVMKRSRDRELLQRYRWHTS
ncbi:MAG: DoxX family membrane protein [Salinivenus sp.]